MEKIFTAFKQLQQHFPWVGLQYITREEVIARANCGQLEMLDKVADEGVCLEIRSPNLEHSAYGCTSDISEQGLLACARSTFERAQMMEKWGLAPLSLKTRPGSKGRYQSSTQRPITEGDFFQQIVPFLKDTSQEMKKYPAVVQTYARGWLTRQRRFYLNSSGAEIDQSFNGLSLEWTATAQQGGEIQHRSYANNSHVQFQGGWERIDFAFMKEQAKRIAIQAGELTSAPPCPSGRMDLILDPHQMYMQIHESIGHPLELDRILGDERNYAGWSFVTLEDFGRLQYGSPLLNVVFNPGAPDSIATYAFDDGGLPAEYVYLIKDGLLLNPLGGAESQERAGRSGVANFRNTNWNRAPIDRMANIDLLPGSASLEEMIASVELGVFMETNRSWSIDDYRRNFQFGTEYGRMIRKGKLAEVVKNPGYRGECISFWHSLDRVGSPATLERNNTPYCGKGEPSQIINVSHESPACLFRNVEVFGG